MYVNYEDVLIYIVIFCRKIASREAVFPQFKNDENKIRYVCVKS